MECIYWNEIPYGHAWEKQKKLFQERLLAKQSGENRLPDLLVCCQHPSVLTLGKSGLPQNLLISQEALKTYGIDFFHIDRGGDITYHGPGQIVVYPIIDLEHYHIGLKEYINRLEEAVIRFLSVYGIKAERLEGATGVWLDAHTAAARKICAIGVKASRYITMHGLALNINTDLRFFQLINPCGFVDKGVTSLQKELGGAMQDIELCRQQLMTELLAQFEKAE